MEKTINTTRNKGGKIRTLLLHFFLVLLVTLLMVLLFLAGTLFLFSRGPSDTARNLFVMSVRETSAIGFLADIFLSDEEIAAIEAGRGAENLDVTDASLVDIKRSGSSGRPAADEWGYVDEDMDGIIVVPVAGESYVGNMMIVLDPSRVALGCVPESLGTQGYTVAEYAEIFDAVAAINGGGFEDLNGQGDGSMPNSLVVVDGEICCGGKGVGPGFVGIAKDYILHVGFTSAEEVEKLNIMHGTGYGPVLVVNGEPVDDEALVSGLNPRTAIGQRSDGAILMLVIDGRQATSLGATYADEAELMLEFGAVNACNLDGGSSSLMWYEGEYINNCASVIGIRDIPTSFVVLREGAKRDD